MNGGCVLIEVGQKSHVMVETILGHYIMMGTVIQKKIELITKIDQNICIYEIIICTYSLDFFFIFFSGNF